MWNLSAPAEYLLELLLKFGPDYETSLEMTVRDRESMRDQLAELPFVADVPHSGGNFLLVRLGGAEPRLADDVRNWLLEQHSIEVKDVSDRFPDGAPRLRIAVRTSDENSRLVEVLRELPSTLLEPPRR